MCWRGCQRFCDKDCIKRDMKVIQININNWELLAADFRQWMLYTWVATIESSELAIYQRSAARIHGHHAIQTIRPRWIFFSCSWVFTENDGQSTMVIFIFIIIYTWNLFWISWWSICQRHDFLIILGRGNDLMVVSLQRGIQVWVLQESRFLLLSLLMCKKVGIFHTV